MSIINRVAGNMQKPISETHPELYHYTTAIGLKGIIEKQTLWATHCEYLNDSMEIKYYFSSRFSKILEDLKNQFSGDDQKTLDHFYAVIPSGMYDDLLVAAVPHITSFCTVEGFGEDVKMDGLLSQWRGYGHDGGYAIVFKTSGLECLFEVEKGKWGYDELYLLNVVYSTDDLNQIQDEFGKHEKVIYSNLLNYSNSIIKSCKERRSSLDSYAIEKMYHSLVECVCRYKHGGFKEEKEVRIVAIPLNREAIQSENNKGKHAEGKPKKQFLRSGNIIPYIDLFEGITGLPDKRLPIQRIIVGPHPEKLKRKKAIEILLEQEGIDAEVMVSGIPFLGR